MSAFREWYSKAFVGNPSYEIESWCEDAWDAAIEYAESVKTSTNTQSTPLSNANQLTCKYCGREIDFCCPDCD